MQAFRDQVAAVTGAGSGMGRSLAVQLASFGCHVAIAYLDPEALAETANQVRANSSIRCTEHPLDVADRHAVTQFAADVVAAHGRVNLVFNNAGVSLTATVEQMTQEDFEWLMNINFWGVVFGTQAFLPHIKATGRGHIVNTSSVFGLISTPTQGAYHAAKFAVKGFTDTLRIELAGSGVGVSCVVPGGVRTNIVRGGRYRIASNHAPTKEQVAAIFERRAGLSSDAAALWILRGVNKKKARILVGWDAIGIAFLLRLFPVAYLRAIAWLARRAEAAR